MKSFGLWRQRHGHGGGWPGKQAGRGKARRRGRRWEEFRGLTPICTLMGERKRPDARADQARLPAASQRTEGLYCLYAP